ncbi:aldehyde dehydrogenase family protein [Leucobacter sp. UCMA 4100]|uniref:aldehyde dehydrogenase family protein n=1 Tax=Leucobacter sp. UCMA 4100 TaxID=2810534 RepID=UPI0022EA610C|nr:aldehyde dehydrogenase family protein [Leucobacter sp. UCMA 4100]MDA3147308.1 aldehyde dehydrogenase family protein [Leucobacter sp. UCMA 4100]
MQTYDGLLAAVTAHEGQTQEVRDPATGAVIGHAPVHSVEAVDRAIETAAAAAASWAAISDADRAALLHRAADAVEAHADALVELLSREQGKPLNGPNARFEVGACAVWLRAAADTPHPNHEIINDESGRATMHYRPIGVVAAITPWNWPLMIAIWQIAPSLRMGNTVVQKPSEYTPLSGLALVRILNTVLPEGVLQSVSGGGDLGARLTSSPKVGKIMFTGSTATGKKIIEASAEHVTRLTLELGGNDAGIVLPDVDAKAIAPDLFWGAFINTGQTCAALKRLYVHDSVYDEVVAELVAFARTVPMGVGLEEQNELGPLQNKMQYDIVDRLVQSAIDSGATIECGGNPEREAPGFFYPTTIVSNIDPHNPLVVEEQFGPALPVVRFSDLDEALVLANELEVGLGASVWSSDREKALDVAARMESGTVWINGHGGLHPMIPFGGAKQSGYGKEFGAEGLKAVAVAQVVSG